MNPYPYLTAIGIVIALVFGAFLAGLATGEYRGKRVALEIWQQVAGDMGMAIVTRYDPITGNPRLVLIGKDGSRSILETKP